MANRNFSEFTLTLEKQVVHLFAHITFGATGAPTLDKVNSKGIVSVTRNSAGDYTLVLGTDATRLDRYNKLLGVRHTPDTTGTGAAPTAPAMYVKANGVASASANVRVVFNAAGTATDPANGEGVFMELVLGNSTAI